MLQLYNSIRFSLSVNNRIKIKSLIHNCTITKCFHMSVNESVPLPPSVMPGNLIHAAIDISDHEERTPPRIGELCDTTMVLF